VGMTLEKSIRLAGLGPIMNTLMKTFTNTDCVAGRWPVQESESVESSAYRLAYQRKIARHNLFPGCEPSIMNVS
jgi:hypothetical protein